MILLREENITPTVSEGHATFINVPKSVVNFNALNCLGGFYHTKSYSGLQRPSDVPSEFGYPSLQQQRHRSMTQICTHTFLADINPLPSRKYGPYSYSARHRSRQVDSFPGPKRRSGRR